MLKVGNPADPAGVVEMQVLAMEHALRADATLPIARPRRTVDGRPTGSIVIDGTDHSASSWGRGHARPSWIRDTRQMTDTADVLTAEAVALLGRPAAGVRRAAGRAARAAGRAGRAAARRGAAGLSPGDGRRACGRLAGFPPPDEIADRRVEITGPIDRKMVINALNSGARVFMADFEDANSPTWAN